MASLVVADELWELRRELEEMKNTLAAARRDKTAADETARTAQSDLASRVSATADRLELLNAQFFQGGAANDAANRR
jgi:cell division protein ZapA